MIRSLLGAIQFLTIVPVRRSTSAPGACAFWFPPVGAAIGAAGGVAFVWLSPWMGAPMAAVAAVAIWCLLGGGLHEDGLTDVADAIRAGRSIDRIHAILKDRTIGVYGGLALVLSVLARWQALQTIPAFQVIQVSAVAHALSRASMVILAYVGRPARSGLGRAFAESLTPLGFSAALMWSIVAAASLGWRPALALLLGLYMAVRFARFWFERRLGTITGDCLGATGLVVEIFALVLFTCQRCSW